MNLPYFHTHIYIKIHKYFLTAAVANASATNLYKESECSHDSCSKGCFFLVFFHKTLSMLIRWYLKPSQPWRIMSGLKTNFNLSPSYSAHKSSNYKFSTSTKTSHDKSIQNKAHIHEYQTQNFQRINPFNIAPVKKLIRLGYTGIVDNSININIKFQTAIKN